MKRSQTSLEPAAHGGLGLDLYLRVTSPLRRYPDLISSRQIRAALLGREGESAEDVQQALAAYQNRFGSLVQAERRSNMMWKLLWLKQHPGWTGEAVMVDRRDRQGFFLIPEIAFEHRVALKKTIPLGSRVRLKLKDVDVPELSVVFVIEEVLE
jgi:exoribonuclease-2